MWHRGNLKQCSEPFPVVSLGRLHCPAVQSKLGMHFSLPTPFIFLSSSHFFPAAILSIRSPGLSGRLEWRSQVTVSAVSEMIRTLSLPSLYFQHLF